MPNFKAYPATPERWGDLERLFGPRGACAGCWCMWPRQSRAEFERKKGSANKKALKKLVLAGEAPGLLLYEGKDAVGWCAIAPREAYSRIERSRILKSVDEAPNVWSVPCFFVAATHRKKGVTLALLKAAVTYAKKRGAKIVEGYPIGHEAKGKMPDAFAWWGFASTFQKAGFVEAARRSKTRPIMRRKT